MKNKQTGVVNLLLVIIVIAIIGIIGYLFLQNNQNEDGVVVEDEQNEVADDIKDVEDDSDEILPDADGLSIKIVSDSQIVLSNGLTLSIDEFPDEVQVSSESSFGNSDRFKSAMISPDEKWLAIAVGGASHDFGWAYELSTKELSLIAFQYGGGVDVKEWISDSEVVLIVSTPKPDTREKVVNVNMIPQYPNN